MDIPSHFAEGKALQIGEFADEGGRNSDERLDYLLMDILPHLPQDKAYPPPMRAEPPHEADQLLSRLGETEMSQVSKNRERHKHELSTARLDFWDLHWAHFPSVLSAPRGGAGGAARGSRADPRYPRGPLEVYVGVGLGRGTRINCSRAFWNAPRAFGNAPRRLRRPRRPPEPPHLRGPRAASPRPVFLPALASPRACALPSSPRGRPRARAPALARAGLRLRGARARARARGPRGRAQRGRGHAPRRG
ncbi:unnamed protein product, partial [Prorocentrum cordatum]